MILPKDADEKRAVVHFLLLCDNIPWNQHVQIF